MRQLLMRILILSTNQPASVALLGNSFCFMSNSCSRKPSEYMCSWQVCAKMSAQMMRLDE